MPNKLMFVFLIYILSIFIVTFDLQVGHSQSSVKLDAEFKPHENPLLSLNDVYQITKLSFDTTDKNICPTNNCKYSLEKGELRYNAPVSKYAVEGLLRINFNADENPRLYDIQIDLMENSTNTYNRTINFVSGNMSIGGNAVFNPYYEYKVTNGTLTLLDNTYILNLQANKFD